MRTYLRALALDDYRLINIWRNDPEITRLIMGRRFFVSPERERKWVEEKTLDNSSEIYWAICLSETHEMIGYISLNNINLVNRTADWGGIVIGERKHRSLDKSLDAVFQMLDYAFGELGLKKVSGAYLEEHKASRLLCIIMGFVQEGLLRSHVFKGGSFHSVIVVSILDDEFQRVREKYLKK